MGAHPDGTGTGWTLTETIDVDQPHGLAYRGLVHLAKAVRKRIEKEHSTFGDSTAGGEHTPGFCKVLKHVDGTADVTAAKDATLFQNNGIVHSAGQQTLWCITGAASDPTILLIDPDKQYKGGDITWTGAHQFDASVDMTILHVDASASFGGAVDFSADCTLHIRGAIDSTHSVLDRVDFSSAGFTGDVSITGDTELDGATKVDGTLTVTGATRLAGDITVAGLMSFCSNNVYDSSWFLVEKATDYAKTHDLSSTALIPFLWFKDTYNQGGDGINRIYSINMYRTGVGENQVGPQIQNLTTTTLTVRSGATYVAECWSTGGSYVLCASGSYRIIAMRLV